MGNEEFEGIEQLEDNEDFSEVESASPVSAPSGDGALVVGEYDEQSAPEDIDIKTSGSAESSRELKFGDKLRDLIHERIGSILKLDKLATERQELMKLSATSKDVQGELRRQMSELKRFPNAEQAKRQAANLTKKVETISKKVAGKHESAVLLNPLMAEAYKLAFKQWKLFRARSETDPIITEAGAAAYRDEPLYQTLNKNGIQAEQLFGWAVYAVALESVQSEQDSKHKEYQSVLRKLSDKESGFLSKFRKPSQEEVAEAERIATIDASHMAISSAIGRELKDIETSMVTLFWDVYTEASAALVLGNHTEEDKKRLRALLRYGMISSEPWFLPRDVSKWILEDCAKADEKWNYSYDATHVLYADEAIDLVAKGYMTPSIDEDLELNERLSPRWKADKSWRRIISTHCNEQCLRDLELMLSDRCEELRNRQTEAENRKAKLIPSAADYKSKNSQLAQEIQGCKVEAARLERVVERINEEYIPKYVEGRADAERNLRSQEVSIGQGELARKEAIAIHRVTRLCARLKDPFPPFALRDNFKLGTDVINDKEAVKADVEHIEKCDPIIFKDQLFPVKKADKRIYLRFCPAIILAPGCGFMGYSWSPRAGAEIGRIVLPSYCPRPGLRERLLHTAFSDFRWDTSKASAGVDLMTSDTICAAYATARWDARKRAKPAREKMAIYTEENDRQNFRRHYSLYLISAMEGGKRLFFKSVEVYDALLRYIILPKGIEKLKR